MAISIKPDIKFTARFPPPLYMQFTGSLILIKSSVLSKHTTNIPTKSHTIFLHQCPGKNELFPIKSQSLIYFWFLSSKNSKRPCIKFILATYKMEFLRKTNKKQTKSMDTFGCNPWLNPFVGFYLCRGKLNNHSYIMLIISPITKFFKLLVLSLVYSRHFL